MGMYIIFIIEIYFYSKSRPFENITANKSLLKEKNKVLFCYIPAFINIGSVGFFSICGSFVMFL